jgi:3-hydroxyacyl-[acyl-carrier-protein] dehydratase
MRFHLIDRVDSYEPSRSVQARKLTSRSESYWDASPDGPRMPPPLALEALCQAGTWLIIISTERRKRAALASIGSVSFLGDVQPGDVLEIVGRVDSMNDEAAIISGRVTVGERPVVEASEIMCVLMDAAELEDPEDTAQMERLLTRAVGD